MFTEYILSYKIPHLINTDKYRIPCLWKKIDAAYSPIDKTTNLAICAFVATFSLKFVTIAYAVCLVFTVDVHH